jgi:hypothetical protein
MNENFHQRRIEEYFIRAFHQRKISFIEEEMNKKYQ